MAFKHIIVLLVILSTLCNITLGKDCFCEVGECCGQDGNCGRTEQYCGAGCRAGPCYLPVPKAARDGSCSASNPCPGNLCCSKFGYCGNSESYCGTGCQAGACTAPPGSTGTFNPDYDGTCSASNPCPNNMCCSQFGFCGSSSSYCGTGCQSGACSSNPSTQAPSTAPTTRPTTPPSTAAPTTRPTNPPATATPTTRPTNPPSTPAPTTKPTTAPTAAPTTKPTTAPTTKPTSAPTTAPTAAPTTKPTSAPTTKPTSAPTSAPTTAPTTKPTSAPTTAPTTKPTTKPTTSPTVAPGTWPNGPLKAIYIDIGINWSDPSVTFKQIVDAGYNYIVLAFIVTTTIYDAATAWSQMSAATQAAVITYAHTAGARIVVSAGGSTDSPYTIMTGTAYGTFAANWAKAQQLDGVDFDLENFGASFTFGALSTAQTVQWVVDATNTARSILGDSAIITHAPQPPYFGAVYSFANGYGQIYAKAPSINFLMVQYYNNGPATTYESIFTAGDGKTSVSEIAALGIPLNKIVVGKPVLANDAGSDYISAATFHSYVTRAKTELGWTGGVMGWQWHDYATNLAWINTIYSS